MINLKFVNAFGRKEICGEWLIREPRPSRLYYAHSGICNFMYQGEMVTLEPGYLYLIPLGYHNWLYPEFKLKFNNFINAGKICMNCLSLFSKNLYNRDNPQL